MIYLDSASTTEVRREVIEAMWPFLTGDYGNPSSRHTVGESAANALRAARATIAEWLGCRASEIVFTSGGTESNNLAIKGIALATPRGRHIVTTAIEHEAVLKSVDYLVRHHDFEVSFVDTDQTGLVLPAALAAALRPDSTLATISHANNEVGTVQPIVALARTSHEAGVPFHADAVQSAAWLSVNVNLSNESDEPEHDDGVGGVDALSISGHKLGAPKGIGVLFIRNRIPREPVLHGGGQERGTRSGTENVAGAVALATAVGLGDNDRVATHDVAKIRDEFIASVLAHVPDSQLTGHPTRRLPAIASFVFPGTNGEAVLLELEARGIVSSSGSACAAGSDEPSHVLTELGYPPDVAQTAVRFSWSKDLSASDLATVAEASRASVEAVRGLPMSPS